MKEFYTTEELGELFSVSSRTIQRAVSKIADELSDKSKGYKIPANIAKEIAKVNNYEFKNEIDGQLVREEYFTENEYNKFYKQLSEYPYLKDKIKTLLDELDYHKKSAESHQRQMEMILKIFEQRNLLEASKSPAFVRE